MTRRLHDVDRELELHVELLTQRYIDSGLTPDAARAKALARMGDVTALAHERRLIEHQTAAMASRARWWQGWGQDLRHAWRGLRRSPGFVALAVVMLALGTGASATVFSVVDGAILRSPFRDPASIAMVRFRSPSGELTSAIPSDAYAQLSANLPEPFVALGHVTIASPIVTRVEAPRRTQTECVSASLGAVLGTRPLMGRWFDADDDRPGATPVAVVSRKFWRGSLSGDPNVIGRTIALDDLPVTVIGVMPAGFDGAFSRPNRDIWVPLGQSTPADPRFDCRPGAGLVNAMARVKTGVPLDDGAAALNAAAGSTRFALTPMTDLTTADLRAPFNALVGAVLAVLLIAFANVTNLGLERLAGRRQELAVRVALGATRWRIIREAVSEHLVISLAGAAIGIAIAIVTFDAMVALLPTSLPNRDAISLNGRVVSVSIALALLGGLLTGTVAACQASASAIRAGMAAADRGHTKGGTLTRRVLVVSELALGVLLLIAALLMIRTFLTLRPSAPGFDPTDKHIALVRLPPDTSQADRLSFVAAVTAQLSTRPGIRQVAATTSVPMRRSVSVLPAAVGTEKGNVYTGAVTPNYFDMMNVPVLLGRGLTERDRADTTPVALVNEAFVRRWFVESPPLGSIVTLNPDTNRPVSFTVVGVVADTRSFGGDTRIRPFLYMPLAQSILGNTLFMVHADRTAALTLPSTVRDVVTTHRPGQLVDEVEVLLDEMSAEVAQPRLGAWLFGLFAGLAVLLAAVGVTATLTWSVAQRTREIGIRMALGARPAHVRSLVVGQSLAMAVTGVATGLLAASWATRLLAGWLYGVTPLDSRVFAAGGAAMITIALLASWVPTHRASRVDPVVALRGH